ncbi:hypothetical protein SAMN05444722_0047 [Rhodovulum sp. ES.010]|uniref:hypothetical protein n=1 Tax=Rhodovulum sp. ES.010 TaxID=1882821 RepID=UPI00092A84FF|nr:hypothetical protein [Rhodovulum sp. ES.010]SIN99513.1 hypothetical protein SAMN05444722_0047 [Rhodovulum sp. ES.010]
MKQGHDLGGIIDFAHRDEAWAERLAGVVDEHFLPALEEFDLDFEDLADILGNQAPWTLWGCAFEDFLSRRWPPDGQNIVETYLKRRGWTEKVLNRAYIEGLRDAHVSLHEVTAVVPGTSMVLRDLLTGADPVTVREKSATRSLKQWDRVAVRVVPVRDRHVISGGLLPFSADAVELLFDGLRDALRLRKMETPRLSVEQLRSSAPLFSSAWLFTHLPRLLDPQMPHLTNTDGEDLVFHELRFPFAAGVVQGQVATVLDRQAELSSDGPKSWSWLTPAKGVSKSKGTGPGLALGTSSDGGTVLGALHLKGKALILEVNSKERAARGSVLITAALGDLLRPPLTTIQTVDQAMRDRDAPGGPPEGADEIPPEIARQIMQEHLDRHYRETLDQPIPALGDKTPREAVRSAAGRKKVMEWLKYLENRSAKAEGTPMAEYDFRWMWEELGVLEERG